MSILPPSTLPADDTAPARRYEALVIALLERREAAGGQLDEATESTLVAELNALWWLMTDAEQVGVELRFEGRFCPQCYLEWFSPVGTAPPPPRDR